MTPEQQQAVLKEAHRWLGTPYCHAQAAHGAGVDCLMLLCAVYSAAGVAPWVDPRPYPSDWMLHRSEERYLAGLDEHTRCLPVGSELEPGDIQMFRFGRTHSHAAIITQWPEMIHAYLPAGQVVLDRADAEGFKGRLGPVYRIDGGAA